MSQTKMIYDLDAGFLDDELLAGQMRLLVGLVSTDRAKSASTRLPQRWQGHEDALTLRLNQLIGEMILRGLAVPGDVSVTDEAILWPPLEREALMAQLDELKERASRGLKGRIRLPRNDHELWASYKYSVLARNRQAYERFGQRVAARNIPLEELWLTLVNVTRVAPPATGVRNALQHMWGYISAHSSLSPQIEDMPRLALDIQQQARRHDVSYLTYSTALGELAAWL